MSALDATRLREIFRQEDAEVRAKRGTPRSPRVNEDADTIAVLAGTRSPPPVMLKAGWWGAADLCGPGPAGRSSRSVQQVGDVAPRFAPRRRQVSKTLRVAA